MPTSQHQRGGALDTHQTPPAGGNASGAWASTQRWWFAWCTCPKASDNRTHQKILAHGTGKYIPLLYTYFVRFRANHASRQALDNWSPNRDTHHHARRGDQRLVIAYRKQPRGWLVAKLRAQGSTFTWLRHLWHRKNTSTCEHAPTSKESHLPPQEGASKNEIQ